MSESSVDLRSNKLNIYLIKDDITDPNEATKHGIESGIRSKEIEGIGILYFKKSRSYTPSWVGKFFKNTLDEIVNEFKSSSSNAVLVVKVTVGKKTRLFAIPFGAGRFILKDGIIEERFGLKTTLNILTANQIRSLGKRTLAVNPKLSIEQISKASTASDFQIDIERDIIQSITGNSNESDFGKIVTGKDALSVSCKTDISNIVPFLQKCLQVYKKDTYKANFDWIDYIKEIKSQKQIQLLNDKLVETIESGGKEVWLSVPSIIDWEDFKGYKYSTRKADGFYEELSIKDFLDETGLGGSLSVDDLASHYISCWKNSSDDILDKWPVFKCMNAEIKVKKDTFLLDDGKWFELNKDFVKHVDEVYNKIPWIKLPLPDYNHISEGKYNGDAAIAIKGCCLDAKNIMHGGSHSKIEFCDIISKKKELLYVKHYSGSATLSHLFAQGYVSGELLLSDESFRQKVIDKIPTGFKSLIPLKKIIPGDYQLIYVLIHQGKKRISIPFFSKVNLKNFYTRLNGYGFPVKLCQVENIK